MAPRVPVLLAAVLACAAAYDRPIIGILTMPNDDPVRGQRGAAGERKHASRLT